MIEQDPKSAEIIRPILRGKDIKRYGYDFADLWLICTFPSRCYNIDDYPAVKDWLANGDWTLRPTKGNPATPIGTGLLRLEQTGTTHALDGISFKSRKKTSNKWFETQDSISYWNDFSKQKIVWSDISVEPSFSIVEPNMYFNNTCYMLCNAPDYMLGILNSKLMDWYFKKIATDLGASSRYFKQFVELLPVIKISDKATIAELEGASEHNQANTDLLVCRLYGLSQEEIQFILG